MVYLYRSGHGIFTPKRKHVFLGDPFPRFYRVFRQSGMVRPCLACRVAPCLLFSVPYFISIKKKVPHFLTERSELRTFPFPVSWIEKPAGIYPQAQGIASQQGILYRG